MKNAHHQTKNDENSGAHPEQANGHYGRLATMIALSFVAMFGLMYAMVDTWGNVTTNLNQFYMAGLMTAPMLMLELALMGTMYPNKRINAALWVTAIIALGGFWTLVREQALIGDQQFLRSMIPHHAGAILMCEQASVTDPKVVALCENILSSQSEEIARMKSWLVDSGDE